MDSRRFDALARRLGTGVDRRALLRGAAAVGVAAFGAAVEVTEAKRLPSNCTRFILAAGKKPTKEFQHIDDDVQIILKPKGQPKSKWRVLLDDHNGTPNGPNGAHFHPITFNAKIGDRIEVIGTNSQGPNCELDAMYLFCATGGNKNKGKKLMDHYVCSSSQGAKTGKFFDKTFRIH